MVKQKLSGHSAINYMGHKELIFLKLQFPHDLENSPRKIELHVTYLEESDTVLQMRDI